MTTAPQPTTREFHVGDILSVTTGRLVSPRHIEGIYDLTGYMTGTSPFSHQLPRLADKCKPSLIEQFPDLAEIVVPDDFGDDPESEVRSWLRKIVAKHGETRVVKAFPAEQQGDDINPFAELIAMRGGRTEGIVVSDDDER